MLSSDVWISFVLHPPRVTHFVDTCLLYVIML
uniref:Uncharacterized protein n=1 Tax=Anguilla anguilla TaxID=7936 RepID=A0A0E9UWA1_ANGAN